MMKLEWVRSAVAVGLLTLGLLGLLVAAIFDGTTNDEPGPAPDVTEAKEEEDVAPDTLIVTPEVFLTVALDAGPPPPVPEQTPTGEDGAAAPTRHDPTPATISGRVAFDEARAATAPARLDTNPVTIRARYSRIGLERYLSTMRALGGRAFVVERLPTLRLRAEYDLARREIRRGVVDRAGLQRFALGLARELRNDPGVLELLPADTRGDDVRLMVVLPLRIESYLRAGLRRVLADADHDLDAFAHFDGAYVADDVMGLRITRGETREGRSLSMDVVLELPGGAP